MTKGKWIGFGLLGLLALFVIWLFIPSEDTDNTNVKREAAENDGDYTILVYMNGSDLESEYDEESDSYYGAASSDLEEMISGLSGDRVRVLVETGGTLAWADERIDAEQNQRWLIEDGQFTHAADVGLRNIGEADTLADFVAWGVEQYPADKYALIFWNHGGGSVLGFGADERFDYDSLTLDELAAGLKTAQMSTDVSFEVIGFDACLMANVETASLLSPYGRYLVASEELEPGHGWDYTAALSRLSDEPDADGATLGRWIADGYRQHAEDNDQEKNITLSVVDMSRMERVVTALEAFAQEVDSGISVDRSGFFSLANGRSRADEYGSSSTPEEASDMVDLLAFVRNVAERYPDTSKELENALQDAVVYNIVSVGHPDASGLSIYFPHRNKINFDDNLQRFAAIGFSDKYVEFLHWYVSGLLGNSETVEVSTSGQLNFSYNEEEDEYAPYEVYVDPEELEQIEQIYAIVSMYSDEDAGEDSPLIYLGYDHYVDVDWEEGIIRDDFTGEWLMWDGNFVTLDLVSQGDGFIRYAIPAKLNGKDVDILVHYDVEEETFEVLGAWKGLGSETGMPDKNIIPIREGDRIVPQFYYYYDSGEDGYMDGDEFVVGDTIDLEYDYLPNGSYLYGFSLVSYSGEETLTDFIEFELED
ncbi:clostripain-related cysteine peptidase [Cohnella fermenti]|uniref:clostripain-related cysteine peptidase n=1 Tax=Cohnella fermenti TaxID=2565925 RepID=UPI001454DC8B|nr:clostripain-related cysteine peptidase [Cohnella fermenti]